VKEKDVVQSQSGLHKIFVVMVTFSLITVMTSVGSQNFVRKHFSIVFKHSPNTMQLLL